MYIVLLVFVQIISTTHRANSVSSLHTLAIDKGTVVAILPQNKALRQYQAREIVDPPNPMLYPSLINTQTHDTLALLNGLTNGFSLIK